ncbi:MAG TPA: hypothetical protein PLZ36_12565, partial [Armatimonadota bacterium]|nr:hypothetical protein [Armatimonadota bacterium]
MGAVPGALSLKPDWLEARQRMLAWWRHEPLDRPCLGVIVKKDDPGAVPPAPDISGMTPEEFVKKINKRDLAGGNLHLSIPGGMVVDSISDLNAYAKAHDRAVKDAEEARKKFREAKTEDELREHGSAAMEHLTAAQLVKEAIQYAVN